MADKHAATYHGSELQRRRELASMSKPELIELVMQREASGKRTQDAINALLDRVRNAYEDV